MADDCRNKFYENDNEESFAPSCTFWPLLIHLLLLLLLSHHHQRWAINCELNSENSKNGRGGQGKFDFYSSFEKKLFQLIVTRGFILKTGSRAISVFQLGLYRHPPPIPCLTREEFQSPVVLLPEIQKMTTMTRRRRRRPTAAGAAPSCIADEKGLQQLPASEDNGSLSRIYSHNGNRK